MVKINFDKKGNISATTISKSYKRKQYLATKTTEQTNLFIQGKGEFFGLKEGKQLLLTIQQEKKQDLGMKTGKKEHNPQVHTNFTEIVNEGWLLPNNEGKLEKHKYEARKSGHQNFYVDVTEFSKQISQEKNKDKKEQLQKMFNQILQLPKPTGHY